MKRLALIGALALAGCDVVAPPTVTRAEYDQLTTGMSYAAAVAVVGEPGEETASNEVPGMPGVPGYEAGIRTKVYMWQNPDGSNMNALFQNDALVQKAQYGLR